MTRKSINSIIRKAGKVVAKITGDKFRIYRPLNFHTPIHESNFVDEVYCSFALNDKFSKSIGYNLELFTTYTGYTSVQPGDIFKNDDFTYVCVSAFDMEPILSIYANQLADIKRANYTATGGYSPKMVALAENVPISIISQKSEKIDDHYSAKMHGAGIVNKWKLHFYSHNYLKKSDIIILKSGEKLNITSLEGTFVGSIIEATEIK